MTLPLYALQNLVTNLSDQTPTILVGEPMPFLGVRDGRPGKYYELSITGYQSKGVDEYRSNMGTTPATANILYSSLNGVRAFTLQIKAESWDKFALAYDMLETVRLRLRSVSAKYVLQNNGLALIGFPNGTVTIAAYSEAISAAVLDVRFAYASTETATDDSGGTIATAPVTGTLS
jgi:hypothetical protein